MEISSLADYDYALLNATWLSLTNEDFQCRKIEALYELRKDSEIVIKMRRIQQGCGVITDSPKVEVGKIGYHSCLCHESFQHPLMGYLLSMYQNYEKGILPFSGGLLDQPAQVMEILSLLSTLQSEREADIQEKANKKGNK